MARTYTLDEIRNACRNAGLGWNEFQRIQAYLPVDPNDRPVRTEPIFVRGKLVGHRLLDDIGDIMSQEPKRLDDDGKN